jgi:acyl carrier protein
MLDFDIDVQNRILVLVKAILEQNAIVAEVGPDASLVDIGLTSMDMVSLMLGVEAEFDFTIPLSCPALRQVARRLLDRITSRPCRNPH